MSSSPYTIDDLPPEIIDKIFTFITDAPADASKTLWPREHPALLEEEEEDIRPTLLDAFNQPLVLRVVNHRWKAIVEGNPNVWCRLVAIISEGRSIPRLLRHLNTRIGWCGSVPLSMYFSDTSDRPLSRRRAWSTDVTEEFNAFFRRHADRWVHLYLDTSDSLNRAFGTFTASSNKLVFSSLRALTLCWFSPIWIANTASSGTQLTVLRLHKQHIQPHNLPARGLLSRSLSSVTTLDVGEFTVPEIVFLLDQVRRRIIHCRVACVAVAEDPELPLTTQPQTSVAGTPLSSSSISQHRHIHLPRLQTLDMRAPRRNGDQNVSFILDSLNAPNLTHLRTRFGGVKNRNYSRSMIAQSITDFIIGSSCTSSKVVIVTETRGWNEERSCAEYVDSIHDQISHPGVVAWIPGFQKSTAVPAFWEDVDTFCQHCFMAEMADDHKCPENLTRRDSSVDNL